MCCVVWGCVLGLCVVLCGVLGLGLVFIYVSVSARQAVFVYAGSGVKSICVVLCGLWVVWWAADADSAAGCCVGC